MNVIKNILKGLVACITILFAPISFLGLGIASLIVLVPDTRGFVSFGFGLMGTILILVGLVACYCIGASLNKNKEEQK